MERGGGYEFVDKIFGGVIDQSKLRSPDKYSPPLKRFFPLTDVRDWQAIEAWAIGLLDQL